MFRTTSSTFRAFASAAVVVCVAAPFAHSATVTGRVLDSTTSLPLAGVEVSVDGVPLGVTTDLMGQFSSEIGEGERLFTFRRTGFSEQSVGPVAITSQGEATLSDAKLYPEMANDIVMLESLDVKAELVKGSSGDLQNQRLKADVAIDFLSADEFAKFGATDIGESLIRVPGVSVVGGQYAVIRGLSDRYTNTTLHGLKIPSPDPEKQSPQLDILPTSLVESLVVAKTFAPQLWADTAGGGIDLATKAFPEARQITVSYGFKINDNALKDGGPSYSVPNDRNDLLARGSHSRPSPTPGESGDDSARSWSIPRDITLGKDSSLPPGQKIGLGYGETFKWGDAKKIGVNLSGGYDTSNRVRSGQKQVLLLKNATSPDTSEYQSGTPSQLDGGTYDYTEAEREVSLSAQGGIGFELNPDNRLRFTSFWTRSGIDTAQANVGRTKIYDQPGGNSYVVGFDQGEQDANYSDGFVPQSVQKFKDAQRYVERSLSVNQIGGEHTFPGMADLEFKWTVQVANTYQDEPAVTEAVYYEQLGVNPTGPDENYGITPGQSGITPSGKAPIKRFWGSTDENQVADRYDFALPVALLTEKKSKFKFGFAREDTDRTYEGKSDTYSTYGGLGSPGDRETGPGRTLDDIYNELIDSNPSAEIKRTTQSRNITAGYLGTELMLPAKFQLQGGARFEKFEIASEGRDQVENISTGAFYHVMASDLLGTEFIPAYATDPAAAQAHVTKVAFQEEQWYPALGLVYSPTNRINFRLNFSQTVGRPSLRELGPYYNRSLETGDYVVGNPALQPSAVDSYDFRAEWFGGEGTMLAASVFTKKIQDPIEKVYLPGILSGQSAETWVNNPNEAQMLGFEFEARSGLGRIDESLRRFSIGGNFSYIDAEVEENPEVVKQLRHNGHIGPNETVTRPLYDQPEYLANIDLTWNQERWGTTATLAVNYIGDVLYASGGGVISINESSFDIYTRAQERVDFFLTQKLADGWMLRVGVKNLTDPVRGTIYDPAKTSGTIIRNEYHSGREYSVSVAASF